MPFVQAIVSINSCFFCHIDIMCFVFIYTFFVGVFNRTLGFNSLCCHNLFLPKKKKNFDLFFLHFPIHIRCEFFFPRKCFALALCSKSKREPLCVQSILTWIFVCSINLFQCHCTYYKAIHQPESSNNLVVMFVQIDFLRAFSMLF